MKIYEVLEACSVLLCLPLLLSLIAGFGDVINLKF